MHLRVVKGIRRNDCLIGRSFPRAVSGTVPGRGWLHQVIHGCQVHVPSETVVDRGEGAATRLDSFRGSRGCQLRRFACAASLTAAAWGLAAAPLLAQGAGGKIEGHVRDQAGAPIANAQVFVVNTTFSTITNSDGFYFFNNVPVGTATLQASFIGYRATRIEGIKILSGQTLTQDVALEATPFEVEEITVIAAVNPLVPRDEVTTKQRLDGDYAKPLPADRISQILALQPGVVASASGGTLFIRGGRADEAVLYLDGVPTQSGSRNAVQFEPSSSRSNYGFNPNVNTVSTVGFDEASITTGAAAAEFGNSQAGVIAV
jgi:hypothetical protein